jgi:hypothetical protein
MTATVERSQAAHPNVPAYRQPGSAGVRVEDERRGRRLDIEHALTQDRRHPEIPEAYGKRRRREEHADVDAVSPEARTTGFATRPRNRRPSISGSPPPGSNSKASSRPRRRPSARGWRLEVDGVVAGNRWEAETGSAVSFDRADCSGLDHRVMPALLVLVGKGQSRLCRGIIRQLRWKSGYVVIASMRRRGVVDLTLEQLIGADRDSRASGRRGELREINVSSTLVLTMPM